MYAKPPIHSEEVASGLANQETNNTNNIVADTEVQTDFAVSHPEISEHIALQLCEMHQLGVLRDRLPEECSYGSPAPKDVQWKTLSRAKKQRDEPIRRSNNVLARAQQEVHCSGSTSEKVRKPRTNKHRSDVTPSKEERHKEINRRRNEAQRKKDFIGMAYEGLLDMKMEVEEKTIIGFGALFEKVLTKLKEALNNNKVMVKHVLSIEASKVSKLLFGLAIVTVGSIAVVSFNDAPTFVKWIIMGTSLVAGAWLCADAIKAYVVDPLTSLFVGPTVEQRQEEAKKDVASCSRAVQSYLDAPLYPPVDVESMFSERWATASSAGASSVYEGLLSVGGGAAFTALSEIAAGAVSLVTGSLFTGGTRGLGERLCKYHRTSKDVKMVFSETMKWVSEKIDKVFGTSFSDNFRKNIALEQWADEVGLFYNKYSEGKLKMTATTGRRVQKYILRGLDMARKYETMDNTSWSLHRFCMGLLHKMESAHGAAGVATMERQVPLTVVLRGESGVGKSYIQHGLCDEIALKVIEEEEDRKDYAANHNSEKYMWSEEEDHVNGYFGQFSVIFDDFGQFLTQKGQTDDFIRLIRLANAAPYRLNCAEMERKGRVMFTSPLILCSTNLYQYWGPSLAKNEALVRRFDIMVEMIPRKEYCTDATRDLPAKERRLDSKKLPSSLEYDACEYHLMKAEDNVQQVWSLQKILTFRELVDVCVDKFNEHKTRHLAMMNQLHERRMEIIQEMREKKELSGGAKPEDATPSDCEKPEGQPVLEADYEGLIGWLQPKAQNLSVFAKLAALKDKMRKALVAYRDRCVSTEWLRYVSFALLFFGVVILLVSAFVTLKNWFRPDDGVVSDPRAFMENIAMKTGDLNESRWDNMKDFRRLGGERRSNKMIAVARKAIQENGEVKAFGKTLRCSLDTFDKWVKAFDEPTYEAELCNDGSNVRMYHNMLMRSILDKNVYHMYRPFDDPEDVDSAGKITMITGTIGMMNYHYLAEMKSLLSSKDTDMHHVVLVNHKNPKKTHHVHLSWFLDEDNISCDVDSDVVLVKFSKAMPVHRDIVKHFVTRETIEQNRDFETIMFAPRAPKSIEMFDIGRRVMSDPIKVRGNVHTNVVQYRALTQTGDCGSLITYSGEYANTSERICGMHMAGLDISGQKRGFATVLTRGLIERLLEKFGTVPKIQDTVMAEGTFLKDYDLCHDFVRKIEKPLFQPTKSSIVKSELYAEVGEVTKRPAALKPFTKDGERVDPVVNAHKRQDSYNVPVDEDLLSHVKEHVYQTLKPFVKNKARKLSFKEAVAGAKDLPCLGPIPRQTSAGFTYKDDPRVRNGKKEFFGAEGEYVFNTVLCGDLEKRVENLQKLAKVGVVPEDRVYTDILKDENLPHEKVDIGKTRMISACDLPMTVLYRMMYGALCNDLVSTRILNGIAVGINPYSKEWDFMVRFLRSKGYRLVAGDFSGYDNSQSCQLIHATVEVMNRLTGHESEEDKLIMEVLAVTLAQPYHASGGAIYQLDHGMPSGNPMTTIMNSIFGMIAFRLCWLKCSYGRYISPSVALAAFNQNVTLVMYGDDNLLNISDEASEFFNQNTMMVNFPYFGLKYTSDQKDDLNPPPYRDISEVTFLKRSFRFCDEVGAYVAPLDKATIVNMLHWTKKGGSERSITLDNCDNAIREWSLHGKSYYDEMTACLKEAVERRMEIDLYVPPFKHSLVEVCSFVPKWMKEHY